MTYCIYQGLWTCAFAENRVRAVAGRNESTDRPKIGVGSKLVQLDPIDSEIVDGQTAVGRSVMDEPRCQSASIQISKPIDPQGDG
jgi:hypothetical protein